MDTRTLVLALAVALCVGGCTAVGTSLVASADATGDTPAVEAGTAAGSDAVPPQLAARQDDTAELHYASPDGTVREEYAQPDIDVSAAVTADTTRVQGQYRQHVFEAELNRSETPTAVAEETATELIDRVDTLDQRQGDLIERYSNGEVSTEQFLRGLLQIRVAARQDGALAEQALSAVEGEPGVALSVDSTSQLDAVAAEQILLPAPVTDSLESAVSGTSTGDRLYVQASASELVLADGGREQTRQAMLRDQRNASVPDQFARPGENPVGNAFERASGLYPASYSLRSGSKVGDAPVYRLGGDHPAGSVTLYLDGGTTKVFHELQTIDAGLLGTTTTVTTNGTLSLTLESTVPSGPMRVLVADEGTPVTGATVRIGGQVVGTTDEGGDIWTTQPRVSERVRAQTPGNASVTATVP
jgi:hypothetical protein